jgi:MFS family permease
MGSTTAGFRSLAHNRDFTAMWVGQTISDFGARASAFVFPLLGYALTGSTLWAAAVEMLFLLGLALTLLPAGVLADRFDRLRLMRGSALLGALLYGSLTLAGLLGALTLPHLLAVATLTGLTTGVFTPAETAAIRTVVPADDLPAALSQQQARQHIAGLLGAPAGGALLSLARWAPFALNACSYAVAWLLLGRIRTDLAPPRSGADGQRSHPLRDLTEGVRFTWSNAYLRVLLIWAPAANLVGNAVFFVAILRLIQAETSPSTIALIEVGAGVAGIAGAAIAPALIARFRTGRLTMAMGWAMGPITLPMALWLDVRVIAAALALIMVINPASNAATGAYRIAVTPDELTGRVQSAMQFASMATMPLAPLLAGVLMGRLGGRDAGLALVALSLVVALIPTCSAAVRSVPRPDLWRYAGAES